MQENGMSQLKETYEEMIVRHLAKELSTSESEELMKWVNERPENQRLFEHLQSVWTMAGLATSEEFSPNVDAAWNKVQFRIHKGQVENERGTKMIKLFPTAFLKVAASVAILIAFGALFLYLKNGNQTIQLAAASQRTLFVLPDSSQVWLQPHSSISYSKGFKGATREVKLEGEGFFEVKRDENIPFVVLGKKTKVHVLGTSFVVHSDPKGGREFVVVATGKVQFSDLSNEQNKVVMKAGDEAFFLPNKGIELKTQTSHNAAAWKTGRLRFDDTPLKQVVSDLELYYGTTITVDSDAMLNCQFTGDFASAPLEHVLDVISVSINATYEKQATAYRLQGAGCP